MIEEVVIKDELAPIALPKPVENFHIVSAPMEWNKLTIASPVDGKILVIIDLNDGTVDVKEFGKEPEIAKIFWNAIQNGFPGRCSRCQKL